jgi:hypothetical protein
MIWRRNCRRSRLLFLAEFLESWIGAHRLFPDFGDPGELFQVD